MKLSVGGYSFCNSFRAGTMDVFGYLETVKYRYGLDAVDLWNGFFADGTGELCRVPDEDYIRKIRQALDERELILANFAIDKAHIWDPDPVEREVLHKNALDHLKMSAALGAQTVRIDTGIYETTEITEEQFEYIVNRFREYCEFAKDNGFLIGPENHMGPSLVPGTMARIAEAVDHPSYGILLHIGRWREDVEQGDAMVARWTVHTHFSAHTVTGPEAVEKVRMLRAAGYDGYWAVEYNAPNNQYGEVEWLLASVKRVLAASEAE